MRPAGFSLPAYDPIAYPETVKIITTGAANLLEVSFTVQTTKTQGPVDIMRIRFTLVYDAMWKCRTRATSFGLWRACRAAKLRGENGPGRQRLFLPTRFLKLVTMHLVQKWHAEIPSTWLFARHLFCQKFARLLKVICCYEQPKLLQPGRNPLLFACRWQKLEEEDRLPIDYESHALIKLDHT